MIIKLNRLAIANFKGIAQLDIYLGGNNATISGRNAAGKSSIFDAFTWLLFGKDHTGNAWTNFAIKPLDESGNERHHLTTSVEGELLVDGQRRTLRRELTEEWIKPRGQKDEVLKGHSQAFWADNVSCGTMREYEAIIAQWIGEDQFKVLTNPTYFAAQLPWRERRKMLLSLAGQNAAIDTAKYQRVITYCNGDVAGGRKRLQAAIRQGKAEMTESRARIRAWEDAMPEGKSAKLINAEINNCAERRDRGLAPLKEELAEIERKLSDIADAGRQHSDKLAAAQQEMTYAAKKRDEYEGERNVTIAEQALRTWRELGSAAEVAVRQRKDISEDIVDKRREIAAIAKEMERIKGEITAAGELYYTLRDHKESADICPTCGQEIRLTDEQRNAKMAEQIALAKSRKEELAKVAADGAKAAAELDDLSKRLVEADERADRAQTAYATAVKPERPDTDKLHQEILSDPTYQALAAASIEAAAAYDRLLGETQPDTTDLLERRKTIDEMVTKINTTYQEDVVPLQANLASVAEADRLRKLIEGEDAKLSATAESLADDELLLSLLEEYNREIITSLTAAVDEHFAIARWLMFDETLDGNPVEICEVTDQSGVPYGSLNDARRIEIGVDIIKGFAAAWGCSAPIIIDNAESSLITDYNTNSQVVRLVVADCDLTIGIK